MGHSKGERWRKHEFGCALFSEPGETAETQPVRRPLQPLAARRR